MSEIINLNRVRKARVRKQAAEQAAENRIRFGRTRSEREAIKLEQGRERKNLDGAKRED